MKKKNNIIITLFFVYFLVALYIFFASAEHGIIRSKGFINLYNEFYWIRLIIIGVATAIFFGLYFFLMHKWEIAIRCPYCNRVMDIHKIKFNLPDGFLCEQTCQNCGKTFTPDDKE